MNSFILLLQLLLLVGMIIAWWGARRDLINIATSQQTPTLAKIEELRTAVDLLLDELDKKIAEIESCMSAAEQYTIEPQKKTTTRRSAKLPVETKQTVPIERNIEAVGVDIENNSRYKEVYSLADSGVSFEEIARTTGLGLSEVQMVISLRPSPTNF